jgi:Flp pilus assembly protein TadD
LTIWAYNPALDAGFVFDDEPNIVDSPAVHWTEFSWDNVQLLLDMTLLQSRPVANFSIALDHLAWGLEPGGFHLTNLLIHLAVGGVLIWVCVLYVRFAAISQELNKNRLRVAYYAVVPVGIFLLHPLNTQAVTYVVQRMTSLAALFVLLAFASYLVARYKATARPQWWYAGTILFGLLALGSKENAILLLPVIVLFEICFFRNEWRRLVERILGRKWSNRWTISAWAIAGALAVFAGWVIVVFSDGVALLEPFKGRDFNGLERLITQTRIQLFYLSLLLWPSPDRLSLDHDFAVSTGLLDPLTTLPAVLACVALLVTAIVLASRYPRYGFPLLAYMLLHAIEAGPVNIELVFEHRMYLPSTMLVVLGAALLVDARYKSQLIVMATLLVLSAPLANWTHQRNQVWADPVEFQADIARKSPDKALPQQNFALALLQAGRSEEALTVIRRAVELAPKDTRPHNLLGNILLQLDRPEEALQSYRTAIDLEPKSVPAAIGIGKALQAGGREAEAFRYYMDTGTKLGQGGLPWQAIAVLKEAVTLRAEDAEAKHALGSAYLIVQKHDEAIDLFRAALHLDSTKFESWYNLGLTADALGLNEEAMRAYQQFVERAPPSLQQPIARARGRIRALNADTSR